MSFDTAHGRGIAMPSPRRITAWQVVLAAFLALFCFATASAMRFETICGSSPNGHIGGRTITMSNGAATATVRP